MNEQADIVSGPEDFPRKIEALYSDACRSSGGFPELAAQRFTDAVDELLDEAEGQAGLQQEILNLAKRYDYVESSEGRWAYDQEEGDIKFLPNALPSR